MTMSATGVSGPLSAHVYTGLLGPDEFRAAMVRAVSAAGPGERFALVLLDLGPSPARRVVSAAARSLRSAAGAGAVAGIAGDDRLGLLLAGGTGADASRVAGRVRSALGDDDLGHGFAIGIAEWRGEPGGADELLRSAARALGDARDGRSPAGGDAVASAHAAQLREYARELRESHARELRRTAELHDTNLATVRTLAAAVEAKDGYTGGHIQRVHELGLLLAKEVVPEEADDEQLAYGFLLHDVGKLSVPDAILTKPGRLTGAEWELMRRHPREGARILAGIPFLGRALHIVLYHHERWDGQGYPHGLRGEEIPQWARLFAIVDTVDAMTSDRPYRAALSLDEALEELRAQAGLQFDPECVAAFERLDRDAVGCVIRCHAGRRAA
jgi:cyclic di-GMP phosphodiesterase